MKIDTDNTKAPCVTIGERSGENYSAPVTSCKPTLGTWDETAQKAEGTAMKIPDNTSVGATSPHRVLQTALTALGQGNFEEVVDQFNDQFTFTDHALGLEFKDKGRLREFLERIREHFPDSERNAVTIFSSENRVTSEWMLTATHTEPFLTGSLRKVPIRVRGVSVVQIEHGKISQWSDYYDQVQSRRYTVAAWFTEWIAV